jgi:calcineurin-like phosphoesterase family protein
MSKIFYIADYHFGHANVIKFDKRPFDSIDEMDRKMIENWNTVVSQDDTVYILGDFCWDTEDRWIVILNQLNGKKVLIRGNHDLKTMSQQLRNKFQDIKDYKEVKDNGKRVLLSHYPMPFYRGAYNSDIVHLYGHIHVTIENDFMEHIREYVNENDNRGNSKHKCQFYNVGAMMPWMNYTPRTLDEILTENEV